MLVPEVVLPGHDLCEVGDPADCLWILQSGECIPQQLLLPRQSSCCM